MFTMRELTIIESALDDYNNALKADSVYWGDDFIKEVTRLEDKVKEIKITVDK